MADVNILTNGTLEQHFGYFRDEEHILVPAGWAPWWVPPSNSSTVPAWQNQIPTFDSRYVDGRMVVHISSPFATHIGGLYQQVPTVAGERYEAVVEGMAWSSESDEAGVIEEASDINFQIGIDPTGGLDGQSPLIVWGPLSQPLGKWEAMRVTITAQAAVATIFLRSAPYLPKRQQSVFWRNVELRPVGRYKRATNIVGAGDTHIQIEPERPQPESEVVLTVSSLRPLRFAELVAIGPDEEIVEVALDGQIRQDERSLWRYTILLPAEGLYDFRFVGDKGARLFAQRLVRIAREVQIVPSGAPRLDFTRVYVLLPPTADEKWFLAAARGSFLGRYTVGFSADDAGVGDVSNRHVIAVNPHHWAETLTSSWYDHHYPGTRFTPVVANKPEDLESWLRDWMYEI